MLLVDNRLHVVSGVVCLVAIAACKRAFFRIGRRRSRFPINTLENSTRLEMQGVVELQLRWVASLIKGGVVGQRRNSALCFHGVAARGDDCLPVTRNTVRLGDLNRGMAAMLLMARHAAA